MVRGELLNVRHLVVALLAAGRYAQPDCGLGTRLFLDVCPLCWMHQAKTGCGALPGRRAAPRDLAAVVPSPAPPHARRVMGAERTEDG